MDPLKNKQTDKNSTPLPESVQTELDRRLFHLQTLYDVSRELLGVVELEALLKNFLMFILTHDSKSKHPTQLVSIGIQDTERLSLLNEPADLLAKGNDGNRFLFHESLGRFEFLPPAIVCVLVFCVDERCSGILGMGSKIIDRPYNKEDKELLETLVNNLVVSIKNARSAKALKEAYQELTILNKAKDKIIHHLSHELRTPVAVLLTTLNLLKKKLAAGPQENWQSAMERAKRNLERLVDMQGEVDDILQKPEYRSRHMVSVLLDQCADELEVLVAEQVGEGHIVERIRDRIEEIYDCREIAFKDIVVDEFLKEKMKEIEPFFSHRQLDVIIDTEKTPPICIPANPLEKLLTGLVKNAIENTPDEGKIEVVVRKKEQKVELRVHDYGVGIVKDHQKRIFEGFYPTQETKYYSSKKPYDFNAGGKGADLLRLKIFSERFNFKLDMSSSRCRHIPFQSDICPGQISQCSFCRGLEDCHHSGGTTFRVVFSA
jgi:signal transduction histidine kinase